MKLPANRDTWQRVAAILDRVLDLPSAERAAELDEACAGDPELRSEVEAFLAADSKAGDFLEQTPGELATTLLAGDPEPAAAGRPPAGRPAAGRRLGPYEVIREIGAGGMGVVYEGWDDRLDRRVALKLLPPDWSRDRQAKERFVREARAAATLDHPNICNVHDVGESDDGQLYIVMAHYEGETLVRWIARGPLPPDEARELAVQIARGLERAHAAGIVHRDVKPSNVMITDSGTGTGDDQIPPDRVKILDFGIARIAGDAGLTRAGVSPGTPAYMSPEQASGEAVDERTDVWSLGVMLYEMLAGRRPFRGDHALAVIHQICNRQPQPLEEICPEVPAALARVVAKAMARDPAERYRNVAQLLADLEGEAVPAPAGVVRRRRRPALVAAAITTVILAGVAVLGSWWLSRQTPAPAEDAVPVVGVVPFVNRTGDAELDWYGEGVARLVADALAPSRHLQVVSALRIEPLLGAASEAELARRAASEAELARRVASEAELARRAAKGGIGYVLTGEILVTGQGLIVDSRLVATGDVPRRSGLRVSAPEPPDLLKAADFIARVVRGVLGVPPAEAVDSSAADFASANPDAYEHYLEGLRAFVGYRYDDARKAFLAALGKAPGYTMARFRLAHVEAETGRNKEALATIGQAVAEADRLPDRDARYVRALEAYISRRYGDTIAAYREILDRYPYETEAALSLARVLLRSWERCRDRPPFAREHKRYEEVLEITDRLARLEPGNCSGLGLSGLAHLALGDLHRAQLDFERFKELQPDNPNARQLLGDFYRAQGELHLAAEEYSASNERDPAGRFSTIRLAIVDVLRGRPEAAEDGLAALVSDLDAAPRKRIGAAFELASLYRSQGRFRQAAAVLARLEEVLVEEQIREAMALAVRGTSQMELGDEQAARRLIDLAVERSERLPGVASTRYLFTRGLLELRQGRLAALEDTATRILEEALPADNSGRTEKKAAAYLRGLGRLAAGEIEEATTKLERAVGFEGCEYAVYRLGLARAYLAAGRLPQALARANHAAREVDFTKPCLDLALDRTRALLVLARVQEARGRPEEAAAHAQDFLERWAAADPGLPDLAEARRLAAAGLP